MKFKYCLIFLISLTFFVSCIPKRPASDPTQLATLNIIDRNGFSETISTEERLKDYENTNFLSVQPYQKVLRVYQKDHNGQVRACITSYHPNGQVKQYLEVVNGRAFGLYQEWYADGRMKIEANVIGGEADLHTAAEQSWLFDGSCKSWDEEGNLLAEISYCKGSLEGDSFYYHPTGALWKKVPFSRGTIHGLYEIYCADTSVLQQTRYVNGKKEGESLRYWRYPDKIAAQEFFHNDLLMEAFYYDSEGCQVAVICQGSGFRAIFSKEGLAELQQYCGGVLQGVVSRFDRLGRVVGKHHILHGLKHGEEIENYTFLSDVDGERPQLLISWYEGKIHGVVKTWYPNGIQESQKEMSNNVKNGLSMAWYSDGTLMMLEEYALDKLVKGEYFPRAEMRPITQVREGSGVATIYDHEGTFIHKIIYKNGIPYE